MADTRKNTPINFIVPGQLQAAAPAGATRGGPAGGAAGDGLRIKASVRLGSTRATGEPVRVAAVPGEDIVVLHVAGGPSLTLHPETARDLLLGQGARKRSRSAREAAADSPDTVEVGAELVWQGLEQASPSRSRGSLGRVLLAGLDILIGRASEDLAQIGAEMLRDKVDSQVDPGVYQMPEAGLLTPLKTQPALRLTSVPPSTEPLLVLVHGTFVETSSTFGKLWEQHPEQVKALFRHYGNRVYALDHPTLGASPIANALTLVQHLPKGARLHLLTHSRGGLVAEVLARVAGRRELGPQDWQAFAGEPYAGQRAELQALLDAVIERDVHVERVVRVACPARGTLLASRRLDAYLSVLKWTLELAGAPLLPGLLDFLNGVAQQRRDPLEFPGLAAMIPASPLVQWLNRPGGSIPGALYVVAGDLQGESVGSWLKTLAADAFYWTDNDIVVQTRSMYGGAPRAQVAAFVLDQGGKSTHFNYFSNRVAVDAVVGGLTQRDPQGYRPIGPMSWAGESSTGTRAGLARGSESHRPAVFVLPGILGSNLRVGERRIWLGLRILGGLDELRYQPEGADQVAPDGAIGMVYDALIRHLQGEHEVVEFSFDWRRPIEEEARRLGQEVQAALDARRESGQPVRLLVHSMGGVVARTMQLECPAIWQRLMSHPQARLVMLGTPNGGSWAPMQVLSGDDSFGNALAAVGSPFQDQAARQLMAGMPGFIQLQAGLTDPRLALDQEETWRNLARRDLAHLRERSWWHRNWLGETDRDDQLAVYEWGVPSQAVLDQARALRQRLDEQRRSALPGFADKLALVVGRAKFTPDGFEWREDEGFVYLNAVDGGDGRVPLQEALLPGVRTWTLDSEHGSLPSAKSAFDAFNELLVSGTTDRLPRLAGTRGAPGAAASQTVRHEASRPSRGRALAMPPGAEGEVFNVRGVDQPTPARERQGPALQVTVVNGNLAFNRLPLFLGHYRSLALTGTESVVDELIGGTMSTALNLKAGSYPDACGTHQVFVNTRRDPARPNGWASPPAAIVVGMGEEGKLSHAMLAATVRQAVLGWLQREAEDRSRGHSSGRVEIAATLLGSGGIGISAGAAARAIVQGVMDANQRVASTGWPPVQRLELVELFLERASEAWRELRLLAESRRDECELEPTIRFGTGPLRRPLDSSYRGAEYDFVRVTRNAGNGTLEFALDSRRARTEVRAQSTQAALVDDLVATAASDSNDDEQLGRTLFQLLVPPAIEPYLRHTGGILLELDRAAAAIPWELLDTPADGQAGQQESWALRTGLLRKLRVEDASNRDAGRRDAIADDDVLVVGEPALTGRQGYSSLPAAKAEAQAVLGLLRTRLGPTRVLASINESARPIINKLLDRRWRIVHISGHGEEPTSESAGGVVLSGRALLGPAEIRAMRTVPELVFINCCHLAHGGAVAEGGGAPRPFNAPGFAAGVAEELIAMGVRCVVAAGWAVDDEAARVFALRFYERLLDGASFGLAVAEARRAAKAEGGNTWGAYQCYGDPGWRYRTNVGDAQAPVVPLEDHYAGIASPPGLTLALEKLAVDAKWRHGSASRQLTHIGHLEGRFAARWRSIGAVCEAFGVAYAAAGAFEDAIRWYEEALSCNDASASIKASEKLGNLLVRQALTRLQAKGARAKAADFAAARDGVEKGRRLLLALSALLPTVERLSLAGSAWKRLALIERLAGNPAGELDCTVAMESAYGNAVELADSSNPGSWDRPAINQLAAQVRRCRLDNSLAALDASLVTRLRTVLTENSRRDPDFWSESGLIEIDLYEHLVGRAGAPSLSHIANRYADLQRRAPARAEWRSVSDQLEFVLGPGPGAALAGEAQQLLAAVRGYAD
ncbi:MAG: CHAT domain-containing protein [Rubrivivax sp.]|nr:CHAT domain-containing protein [Rubrivivax sp.]